MKKTRKWIGYLFALAWLLMVVGIAGIRWEFLPLQAGLLVALVGAVVAFIYGLLTLPVFLFKLVFRKSMSAATPTYCLLGLLPGVVLLASVGVQGMQAPAIHDITTDTENPPRFVLAARERSPGDNDTEYEGEVIARLQQEAYGDVEPVIAKGRASDVESAVQAAVRDMGWRLLGVRRPEDSDVVAVVEAVARSAIFGFEDDVAIRISHAPGNRVRVDIRSASRVGLGDLGANAKRVKAFKTSLAEKL